MRQRELAAPLKRKKPAIIGVQFMGDLFHKDITNEQIAAVFGVMAATPQHRYYLFTKRPREMYNWFVWADINEPDVVCGRESISRLQETGFDVGCGAAFEPDVWPLPNVTPGASVEDQKTADERVLWLLKTPAARRMVSYEPALGALDLNENEYLIDKRRFKYTMGNYLDWVICGAETGPGARPMNLDWARSVRAQCKAAGVPFFFKRDSQGSRELDGRRHEEMP